MLSPVLEVGEPGALGFVVAIPLKNTKRLLKKCIFANDDNAVHVRAGKS